MKKLKCPICKNTKELNTDRITKGIKFEVTCDCGYKWYIKLTNEDK